MDCVRMVRLLHRTRLSCGLGDDRYLNVRLDLSFQGWLGEVVSGLIEGNATIILECCSDLRILTVVQSVDILILERFEEY